MKKYLISLVLLVAVFMVSCSKTTTIDSECDAFIDFISTDIKDFKYKVYFVPNDEIFIEEYLDSNYTNLIRAENKKVISFHPDTSGTYEFYLDMKIHSKYSYKFYITDKLSQDKFSYKLSNMRFKQSCLGLGEITDGDNDGVAVFSEMVSYSLNGVVLKGGEDVCVNFDLVERVEHK